MKKFDKVLKAMVVTTILMIIPTFAMEFIDCDSAIFLFIKECLDYLFLIIGGISAGMLLIRFLKDEHII